MDSAHTTCVMAVEAWQTSLLFLFLLFYLLLFYYFSFYEIFIVSFEPRKIPLMLRFPRLTGRSYIYIYIHKCRHVLGKSIFGKFALYYVLFVGNGIRFTVRVYTFYCRQNNNIHTYTHGRLISLTIFRFLINMYIQYTYTTFNRILYTLGFHSL